MSYIYMCMWTGIDKYAGWFTWLFLVLFSGLQTTPSLAFSTTKQKFSGSHWIFLDPSAFAQSIVQSGDPRRATALKSWKTWMRIASTLREVDRRRYRPWRWQTLRDRRTRDMRPLIRSDALTIMDQNVDAVSRKALAHQSSISVSTTAHCQMRMALRTLKSLSWILMIMICLSQSTLNWGHHSSLSVSCVCCVSIGLFSFGYTPFRSAHCIKSGTCEQRQLLLRLWFNNNKLGNSHGRAVYSIFTL